MEEEKVNSKENQIPKLEKKTSELTTNPQKIKELNNKISVLIKGIKEEREKSKALTKELELLKYDKILKEEQISKLKSENESLNLFLSKNDPKSYFENITKINTNNIDFNPEEYNLMKEENVQLKKENTTLIEHNSVLKTKIEKLDEEYKTKEKGLKQNKIELLNNLYKDIEIQKNNKEGDIIKYQENEIKNKKIEENLEEKIKDLEDLNNKQKEQILKLKNIIDNSSLDIDKYIFKGFVTEDDFNEKELFNKEIQMKFDSNETFIKLYINNQNMEIDAKKIKFTFYKTAKEKVMIFYENDKGEKNAMLCEFTEKECDYLFKFKKIIMDKYDENKKNKETSTGGFLFGLFNG